MNSLGKQAEELACRYLTHRGYSILARNYRAGPREIDIVAQKDRTIIFVEVKARTKPGAIYALTRPKQRHLIAAATQWIFSNRPGDVDYRFDAIAITWRGNRSSIEHIPNAWRA